MSETDAIAIVAVACRFPGAPDVETFWGNLCAGVESIHRYDPEALEAIGVPAVLRSHPRFVPAGALVDGVDRFDADLFGFTPRDAEILDPQHRLFFECAWEALERGGYAPGSITVPVGVFGGTSLSTYLIHHLIPEGDAIRTAGVYQAYIGNDKDSLTTHLAYKLNLKGPCVTIQTACSTSLVAAQYACQSLLAYQCDLALAGGVSLQIPHQPGYVYQEGAILSPDGHCRAFDAKAAGTVSGNGVGIVLLKRLDDAIADGDPIVAVVRGGAVNNDGASKVGYTAPSVDGQTEVIAMAQALAGTPASTIGYVEAHGTGTPLGDPIEIEALTRAFHADTPRRRFCALGSVKTNIGHLDAAAGVAGLIKAALAVQHGVVPPSLHFEQANPNTRLDESPFFVPTAAVPWPLPGQRRAGVSSFGIGGTNAHLVLEEAPAPSAPRPVAGPRDAHVLTVSARSASSVDAFSSAIAAHLERHPDVSLAEVAFTLQTGRRAWPHRRAVTCRTREEAIRALGAPFRPAEPAGSEPVFLFSGQGTQHPGMARRLYETEAVVRDEIDACCAALRPGIECDLRDLLLAEAAPGTETIARLDRTALAQPALFVLEYALARLWMSWGITPAAMIGHSLGEYVAACVAGVFSRDEGLALVAARGRAMQRCDPGAMVAVALGASELEPFLPAALSIAAINATGSTVVSGPFDAVAGFEALLAVRRVAHRRVETSHAFHSAMMEPALDELRETMRGVRLGPPRIPIVSNLTGRELSAAEATDPEYWVRHARGAVRFAGGLATLARRQPALAIEVGPGRTLATFARQAGLTAATCLPGRHDAPEGDAPLARAVGQAWTAGLAIDWTAYQAGRGVRRTTLPVTPFERRRYWIEPPDSRPVPAPAESELERDHLIYRRAWMPAALSPGVSEGPVLVIGTAVQGSERIAAKLREGGRDVTVATAATEIEARSAESLAVVDLSGIVVPGAPAADAASAFDAPLALARLLSAARVPSARLLFVVNRLVETGSGCTDPLRALVMGPALVIPQEYPQIDCSVVDIDAAGTVTDEWIDLLAREIDTPARDAIVAYRSGTRAIPSWEPRTASAGPTRLEEGGVYWITGATGAIGRALAQHLASRYRGRLLLTARSLLSADFVASLETAGAQVVARCADVADHDAMREARDAAAARFGRIDGIFHSAGIAGGGVIALSTPGSARPVLSAKVDGARIVGDLARETPVRFIVLCSSIASLQGGPGQADYVAANAYLDAFAAWHTRASGIVTISVCWDAWREAGMAVEVTAGLHVRAGALAPSNLAHGLPTNEAIGALERVLAGADTHVAVSTTDLDTRIAALRNATRVMTTLAGAGVAPDAPDTRSIETQVGELWERVLGVTGVAGNQSFFDIGGDSLKGVQLVSQLNERFGLEIPVARFFEAPTVNALAALVRDARGEPSTPALAASQDRGRLRREHRRGRASA